MASRYPTRSLILTRYLPSVVQTANCRSWQQRGECIGVVIVGGWMNPGNNRRVGIAHYQPANNAHAHRPLRVVQL